MSITREALLAAGYFSFTQKNLKSCTESFYQKCFRDAHGKRFYITIAEYNNSVLQQRFPDSNTPNFSYEPDVQFTDAKGSTFNVSMLSPKSVEEMEGFFEQLFVQMECEHYERNYEETNEN